MTNNVNFAHGSIIGKRKEQQDTCTIFEIPQSEYVLYLLADGMGGHVGGQQASSIVVDSFLKYFQINDVDLAPEASLREALELANSNVVQYISEFPETVGMGTTVIAVLLHTTSNQYWFLSVGDSPLYHYGTLGLERINANHSYSEILKVMVEQGQISQEDANTHKKRRAVTSAITGKTIKLIDIKSGVLNHGELLLLASDGVQTLDDSQWGELGQYLSKEQDYSSAVNNILGAVEGKGVHNQDNASVILLGTSHDLSIFGVNSSLVEDHIVNGKVVPKRSIFSVVLVLLMLACVVFGWYLRAYLYPNKLQSLPTDTVLALDEGMEE